MISPAEIGQWTTIIMAVGGAVTGAYALWSGWRKDKRADTVTAGEIEQGLRDALYKDFNEQRQQNSALRKRIKHLEEVVETQNTEIETQKDKIETLETEVERLTKISNTKEK